MNQHIQGVTDFLRNLIFDNPADDPVGNLARGYAKTLNCHDDLLIDSDRKYLLMASLGNIYLVSRDRPWRARLNEDDLALYKERGRRVFSRIARNHK